MRTPLRSLPEPSGARLALAWSLLGAAPFAAALGLIFSLRAGAGMYPVLVVILWRGYGPRVLVPVAALLLGVVVPIVYLGFPPPNLGGYQFQLQRVADLGSLDRRRRDRHPRRLVLADARRPARRATAPAPRAQRRLRSIPGSPLGAPDGQLTGVSG